jgi:hypothetical protein
MRRSASFGDILVDVIEKYEDELMALDSEYIDGGDDYANRKQDALFGGDLDTALLFTRDRRVKEVLLTIQSDLDRIEKGEISIRRSASDTIRNLEARVARLEYNRGQAYINLDLVGENFRTGVNLAHYIVDEGFDHLMEGKLFIKDGLNLVDYHIGSNLERFETLLKQEMVMTLEDVSIGNHRSTSNADPEELEDLNLPDVQDLNRSRVSVERVISPTSGTPGYLVKVNGGSGIKVARFERSAGTMDFFKSYNRRAGEIVKEINGILPIGIFASKPEKVSKKSRQAKAIFRGYIGTANSLSVDFDSDRHYRIVFLSDDDYRSPLEYGLDDLYTQSSFTFYLDGKAVATAKNGEMDHTFLSKVKRAYRSQ